MVSAVTNNPNQKSLFPLIFLSKHISLYALGRLKWILDIIWPLNQHLNLKNQRNWIKQVFMFKFLTGINCILLHWRKKLTLNFQTENQNFLEGFKHCTRVSLKSFHLLQTDSCHERVLFLQSLRLWCSGIFVTTICPC